MREVSQVFQASVGFGSTAYKLSGVGVEHDLIAFVAHPNFKDNKDKSNLEEMLNNNWIKKIVEVQDHVH